MKFLNKSQIIKSIFPIGSPAKRAMRAGKREGGLGEGIFARPLVLGDKLNFSVGVLFKEGSNFVQNIPPIYDFGFLRGCCLALASLGLGKSNDFIGIFKIQKQFLSAQTEVRCAEDKHKFEKFISQSFFFRRRRKAKR